MRKNTRAGKAHGRWRILTQRSATQGTHEKRARQPKKKTTRRMWRVNGSCARPRSPPRPPVPCTRLRRAAAAVVAGASACTMHHQASGSTLQRPAALLHGVSWCACWLCAMQRGVRTTGGFMLRGKNCGLWGSNLGGGRTGPAQTTPPGPDENLWYSRSICKRHLGVVANKQRCVCCKRRLCANLLQPGVSLPRNEE